MNIVTFTLIILFAVAEYGLYALLTYLNIWTWLTLSIMIISTAISFFIVLYVWVAYSATKKVYLDISRELTRKITAIANKNKRK